MEKKPCCFLLLSLNAAGGGSSSSPGSFCAARAWSAHTVSSRGQFCRGHAAWPGRPPRPSAMGPGAAKGPKASAGRGGWGPQSRSCCSAGACPRTDNSTTLDLLFFFQTHYFFMDLLFFSQIRSIFCPPCFPCLVRNLVPELHRCWVRPNNLSSQHHRFDLYR